MIDLAMETEMANTEYELVALIITEMMELMRTAIPWIGGGSVLYVICRGVCGIVYASKPPPDIVESVDDTSKARAAYRKLAYYGLSWDHKRGLWR